jgi:hypothetical protein
VLAAIDGGPGRAARDLLPPGVVVVDLGPRATLNVNTPADLERARTFGPVPDSPDGAC